MVIYYKWNQLVELIVKHKNKNGKKKDIVGGCFF